jgi:hypothetical protein
MHQSNRLRIVALAAMLGAVTAAPVAYADHAISWDVAVKYLLATIKAFRTTYVLDVIGTAKKSGIEPKENWKNETHAIPLPAQFVLSAGEEVAIYEIGLISLDPLYEKNKPKTPAEADALKRMQANPKERLVTFLDGDQFKGMSADLAIVQSCVDCHNTHPNAVKRDFKKGDVMGALVVRLNKEKH